jgi:hypothetical protein
MKNKISLLLVSLFALIGTAGLQACFYEHSYPPSYGYYGGPPAYAYAARPPVVYGDYDDHHEWHDRGWWVHNNHEWVEHHHADWLERGERH